MKTALLLAFALIGTSALADDIRLGQPAYGGNGCPAGTASAALSPDQKTLSILFDQYQVEAGRTSGRSLDRKSCNIAIPVHVPQGYSISLFKVDYRGFNSLPSGAHSRLNVNYFFAGQKGPVYTKDFFGEQNQNYFLTNDIAAESTIWSPCGIDTNLRVNSDLMVQSNNYGQQALSTVDSTDIKAGLIYHVQWKRCR
jgi:hypothetical protein